MVCKLHGYPKSIVSDRDPIFLSKFWRSLFKSAGTQLATSSAYHPQSDGQTEVVNRCIEQYLRCFTATCPNRWIVYLPWAEWCYNTSYHTSTGLTPFQVVYGRTPPTIPMYIRGSSTLEAVDSDLAERDTVLHQLKLQLHKAQQRMKSQADKHRTDTQFNVGDWVWLKLQPYRQHSLAKRGSSKLCMRYFGPYLVTKRVGLVAYRLQLPTTARIHNVFHVSQLKAHKSSLPVAPETVTQIPATMTDLSLQPLAVISSRIVLRGSLQVPQVLIQWQNFPVEDSTWEDLASFKQTFPDFDLEDKVDFNGRSIDTRQQQQDHQYQRPQRSIRKPRRYQDGV